MILKHLALHQPSNLRLAPELLGESELLDRSTAERNFSEHRTSAFLAKREILGAENLSLFSSLLQAQLRLSLLQPRAAMAVSQAPRPCVILTRPASPGGRKQGLPRDHREADKHSARRRW